MTSSTATADLADRYPESIIVFPGPWVPMSRQCRCAGHVVTVRVDDDNSAVRDLLSRDGDGEILLVDGHGSKQCALLGDNLAALAVRHRWAGVIVYGCVRDRAALRQLDLAIWAIGTNPRKSGKEKTGEINVPVSIEGVIVHPGDYLYADEDGIVVSRRALHL